MAEIKFTQWQMVKIQQKNIRNPFLNTRFSPSQNEKEDAAKKQKIIRNFACAPFAF